MPEDIRLLEEKLQNVRASLDQALISQNTLDVLAAGWKQDKSRLQQLRDVVFAYWRDLLAKSRFNTTSLNRLQDRIRQSKWFLTTISAHPNVIRTRSHIFMLWLLATFLQILITLIYIIAIAIGIALVGGLAYGAYQLVVFLFATITTWINQGFPGSVP